MTAIKICGLSEPVTLKAAAEGGARFAGFVFYPPSPRNVSPAAAAALTRAVPTGMRAVGLFVNPEDSQLEQVLAGVALDMIQLHGDESPARVAAIRARCAMPVIKALRVATPDDLAPVADYEEVADWLLFDSKPDDGKKKNSPHPLIPSSHHPFAPALPGGTGHAFDWAILKGRAFRKPWMLGGGLHAGNVAAALKILQPDAVDISSGVESSRGVKDEIKIREFIAAVKACS